MKKWIAALLVALLALGLMTPALALIKTGSGSGSGVDLSGLSFEELVALKDQVNRAMWDCEEWQEVTVPQGVYTVGDDIPAGHWSIAPVEGGRSWVKWTDALDESGKDIDFSGDIYFSELIYSKDSSSYSNGDLTSVDIEMKNGQFIIVTTGDVVFTPYSGKPDLGFKK